jgi:hypothetical protein
MDFRVYEMRVISRLNEKVLAFQGGLRWVVLLSSLVAALKSVFEIRSVLVVLCVLNTSKQITQLAFALVDSVTAPTKMANKFERSWCWVHLEPHWTSATEVIHCNKIVLVYVFFICSNLSCKWAPRVLKPEQFFFLWTFYVLDFSQLIKLEIRKINLNNINIHFVPRSKYSPSWL